MDTTKAKRKIALLSNIMSDLIVGRLRRKYDFYQPNGFDTWVQEALDPSSGLYSAQKDAVFVLLDGTEARSWKDESEAASRMADWKTGIRVLADACPSLPIFVTTIDIRENRIKAFSERRFRYALENEWYQYVQAMAEEKNNLFAVDLAGAIADQGRSRFYSDKMWYMSSMPYSREGLAAVCLEIERALNAAFGERKKIIALDLDNTLWGGVVGEEGVEGIELSEHKEGQRYHDFQRQLLEMKKRGILLAVNSKNNLEDAEKAIGGHPAMLLRDGDFVSLKINWENKAVNLKAMEKELNLSENGFIFVDDNPVERETVRGECPEALTPDFPEDSTELISFAESIWFDHCVPLRTVREDLTKTEMYRNEAKRHREMAESVDLDGYIAKLGVTVDIHRMRPEELDRVTQLCNKTNQFNLTTKRYTKAEIEAIAARSENAVYVVYSADKYGDNGLISVVILTGGAGETVIDTFLMSCRVMGRKIEEVIIGELAEKYKGKGRITGRYIPTAKNAPVRELYDRLGFALLSEEDGVRTYALDPDGQQKKEFGCFASIRFDG